jgi:uncharacterized protein (DUF2336 family)
MSATAANESYLLIDELEETLASGNGRDCERMLKRVADLFMAGSRRYSYSEAQIALFDDVLLRLAAEIEAKARAMLAQRLAYLDNAPPKLIRAFAFDDAIEVARPVLSFSPRLSDADLVENAKSKSQEHLYAIGRRLALNELITDVLVERGDDRVVRALARNSGAHFSAAGFGKLTTRAGRDCVLAFGMVQRDDLPRQYFDQLLATASANVRAVLEATHPQAGAAIRDAVDEVAGAMRRESRSPARAEQLESTVAALARLGPYPAELIQRLLREEGADMVLTLAKAASCPWASAKELLAMFAAKGTLSPDDLSRAATTFDRLKPETARRIVDFRAQRAGLRPQGAAKVAVFASPPPRKA